MDDSACGSAVHLTRQLSSAVRPQLAASGNVPRSPSGINCSGGQYPFQMNTTVC